MRQTKCIITGKTIEVPDCKFEFNKIKLARAAGFYNGEGCISINSSNKDGYYLSLIVVQEDPRELQVFMKALGIHKYSLDTFRNFYKQFKTNRFEEVQFIVCMLWNELSESKREQYKKAIGIYLAQYSSLRVKNGGYKNWSGGIKWSYSIGLN